MFKLYRLQYFHLWINYLRVSVNMAAKTHVDVSVSERRLRPIYDWLDNGNNRKALQEAEKVLKKQPNFQCAKVLKALALSRSGRDDECEQILESVRKEVPCEDSTLQAMTLCYREINKPKKICEIYEAATKKDPNNEELLTHLFMAHVRVNDYRKQQQTAWTLYKLKPKNPYYFWTVMSIVMQAYKGDDKLSKGVVLPLAERMVAKFVQIGKIEAEQEVQLYLMILEMQEKYAEALEVLSGPLSAKLVSCLNPVPIRRAGLLMKMKRWNDANLSYKLLLRDDLDRWSFYQDYFTSSFHLFDESVEEVQETASSQDNLGDSKCSVNSKISQESSDCKDNTNDTIRVENSEDGADEEGLWSKADSSPEEVKRFLGVLSRKNEKVTRKFRGPYLAYLELYQRLLERGKENPSDIIGDVISLFMAYFRNFGDKLCCFPDLKIFLHLLPEEKKEEFISEIKNVLALPEGQFAENPQQMQQHINLIELSRRIGFHQNLPKDERVNLASDLTSHYAHGVRFASPLHTDFSINDMYALIACHLLYEEWIEEKLKGNNSKILLLQAMTILELVLSLSPSNYHAKLLLLKFYNLIGAGKAAQAIYELLDVKHMQLDSLGHIHCCHIYSSGSFCVANDIYRTTLRFFTANYKDSVDHLTFSYKFGSFLTIEEFVEFRERLDNSLHYSSIVVENTLLEILRAVNYAKRVQIMMQVDLNLEEDKIKWGKLQDNRDLKVMMAWDPPDRQITPELTKETFEEGVGLLKLRSLVLHIIGAAITLSENYPISGEKTAKVTNGSESSSEKDHCSLLQNLVEELTTCFTSLSTQYPTEWHEQRSLLHMISAPLPSRLFSLLRYASWCQHLQLMVKILTGLVHQDHKQQQNAHEEPESDELLSNMSAASDLLEDSLKELKEESEKCIDPDCDLTKRKSFLEHLVLVIEMISFAVLICEICQSILKPWKNAPTVKKTKKKKEITNIQQPKTIDAYNKMVNQLKQNTEELKKLTETWEQGMTAAMSVDIVVQDRKSDNSLSALWKNLQHNEDCNNEEQKCTTPSDWFTSQIKVVIKAKNSYKASAVELRQLLNIKAKNLVNLHV